MLRYVLITPARNEAAYIEKTIESVLSQSVLPLRWVIVSDGSSDGTDEIVRMHLRDRQWLQLLRLPDRGMRDFAAKAQAFQAGRELVTDLPYEIIGNLDADVSFGPDFMEFLLGKFAEIPELGVAGTHYREGNFHSFDDSHINIHHVNGQCQLFRKTCLDEVGGYVPLKGGGIDWVAVTTARMKGWRTQSFGDRVFEHHRKMGTAETGALGARFQYGKKDYLLGGHPMWQVFRSAYQMFKKPYVLGGVCLMLGYVWCWIRRVQRPVPPDLMLFHRNEQLARLRTLFADRLSRSKQA